jgi:sigma-B regulation protein RsbU (phosphoserine phosphatase)
MSTRPSPATPARCVDEGELGAAARLQRALLPPASFSRLGYAAAYRYSPAGPVGGDIVDLIPSGDRLYFLLADVSGKGIAASILTGYIHAIFRSLVPLGLSLEEIVGRASALLCASTLPAQYATLVFGYADGNGHLAIVNAGHPPPLIIAPGREAAVVPTGAAAGLFCDSTFGTATARLEPGDTLLLYSDGVTESFDAGDQEYGAERLQSAAAAAAAADPQALLTAVSADHARFLSGAVPHDDLTLLAIRREPTP